MPHSSEVDWDNQESVRRHEEERRAWNRRFEARLAQAAKTHGDLFLGEREWHDLGFQALFPDMEIPTEFGWTIYVKPTRDEPGTKRIGIKLFGSEGLYDMLEGETVDPGILYSDAEFQALIDSEMQERWKRADLVRRQEKAAEERTAQETRGFPPGKYRLVAVYPKWDRSRETIVTKDLEMYPITVQPLETAAEVDAHIRAAVSMHGLHNFGLDTYHQPGHIATVEVRMTNDDVERVVHLRVAGNGHVARD